MSFLYVFLLLFQDTRTKQILTLLCSFTSCTKSGFPLCHKCNFCLWAGFVKKIPQERLRNFCFGLFLSSSWNLFFQICDISKLKKIKNKNKNKPVQEWELATWFCVLCANIFVIKLFIFSCTNKVWFRVWKWKRLGLFIAFHPFDFYLWISGLAEFKNSSKQVLPKSAPIRIVFKNFLLKSEYLVLQDTEFEKPSTNTNGCHPPLSLLWWCSP